ncbi:MAG: dienelactone hydrolase family protein, partial [Candidatus Rokubacteria bacterium]|nr:dienelactone hydrolase family protein [Candidatus Rokubacteria bacterium]
MGSMIQYQRNGQKVSAYLATPPGAGPFPAVIVIQEWWGVNAHIRDVADRYAREGYVALAP